GQPIPSNVTYRTETDATGLLADIYNPENQARFANKMMGAPGGVAIANAMTTQMQQGGQVLDRMDYENSREDAIFNMVRDSLFGTPQTRPQTNIPTMRGRQPVTPNINPVAPISQGPSTTGRVEKSARISPDVKPTGTAADFDTYSAMRQQLESYAMHPAMKDSMRPVLNALDATWGYGEGAPNAIREWRAAQRFNDYSGSFEDWKKMTRQTIMDKTQGGDAVIPSSEVKNFLYPDGSHPLPGTTTYNQAYGQGATYLTESEQKETRDVKSALALTRNMRGHLENIYKDWDSSNPIMSRAELLKRVAKNKITQEDVPLTKYERLKKGTLAKLIRAMGEKGALAEGDVERGLTLTASFFPIPDSKEVAFGLFDELEAILTKAEVNEKAISEAEKLGYSQRRFNAQGVMIFSNPNTGEEVVWED
ncbi:MAG: hypothetical protein HKP62_07635, partial [Sulfurovum sp.]|nr:hypothetical protein [Sulfurovum sp.]NNJ45872.1 hypothetical protein [Sulfurovum sp.]